MRQRLGIAAALLPGPDLVILDEPTNGLDPAGILEVRALMRGLAAEGTSVLVSSHLLSGSRPRATTWSSCAPDGCCNAGPRDDARPAGPVHRPPAVAAAAFAGRDVVS